MGRGEHIGASELTATAVTRVVISDSSMGFGIMKGTAHTIISVYFTLVDD